jgi:anti-sigma regulatory factor (Ser/Thr protein kinase)
LQHDHLVNDRRVIAHQSSAEALNGREPRVPSTDTFELREVFRLPARRASAAEARRRTFDWLTRHLIGQEPAEAAVLIVSELVTNAVMHSASSVIGCTLRLGGGLLYIEVTDQGAGGPEIAVRAAAADDVSGRGLLLVSALSKAWGVTSAVPRGLTVWAAVGVQQSTSPGC